MPPVLKGGCIDSSQSVCISWRVPCLQFYSVSDIRFLPVNPRPPIWVSKMAITRASRVKTRGTSAHRIRNFMLFDLVRRQILPKMHVAPGNPDLLPFST